MKRKSQPEKTHIISATTERMGRVFLERESQDCDHFTKDRDKAKPYSHFDTRAVIERISHQHGVSGVRAESLKID